MRLFLLLAATIAAIGSFTPACAQEFRLVRSVSEPSGKVVGATFVLDEVRGRFVYPQDKSFIVYFEWEGTPGMHVLSAQWKRPDGQVDSISPEVKIQEAGSQLTSYWTYTLEPYMKAGVWTVEIRIDGQPAGSHAFEIAGTSPPPVSPVVPVKAPTLDDIFRGVSPSLVWVRKINAAGRRIDSGTGFVIGKNRIATAFQAIDGARRLEIEFAGGRKLETDAVLACSRKADWAVLAADVEDVPAIPIGDSKTVAVGERLIVFHIEGDARVLGGVDISGRREIPGAGERIQFTPGIALESAGGPLLYLYGNVVGVLGGSVLPASRFNPRNMSVNPRLGIATTSVNAAIPLSLVPADDGTRTLTLSELAASGVLTAPLGEMEGLLYVTTSIEMGMMASDPLPRDVCEFSRRDKQLWVISEWQRKGKVSKGMMSAKVYDVENRARVTVEPRKMSLSSAPTRTGFSIAPGQLEAGLYRVDLLWEDQAVWRTFIRITE